MFLIKLPNYFLFHLIFMFSCSIWCYNRLLLLQLLFFWPRFSNFDQLEYFQLPCVFDMLVSLSHFLLSGWSCLRIIVYCYMLIPCISHSPGELICFKERWNLKVNRQTFVMVIAIRMLMPPAYSWKELENLYFVTFSCPGMHLSICLSIYHQMSWVHKHIPKVNSTFLGAF